MSAADVVCLPSLWEGLPKTLIEAACFGIPAAATDVKGNREVIVEGETGLLAPPADAASAASALGVILNSPETRSTMGVAAAPLGQAYQRENPHPRLLSDPPHRLLPIPEAA
jgi:glycosyltransferase involved in cell wall biosynthesis